MTNIANCKLRGKQRHLVPPEPWHIHLYEIGALISLLMSLCAFAVLKGWI